MQEYSMYLINIQTIHYTAINKNRQKKLFPDESNLFNRTKKMTCFNTNRFLIILPSLPHSTHK